MHTRRTGLLLAAALLCGAANDAGLDEDARTAAVPPTGGYAEYLVGRYAAQRGDMEAAAEHLGAALRQDGGDRELLTQAFIAAVMAGRPEAPELAGRLPDNVVAQLLLADREADAGRWDAAEARYAALPQQSIAQVLRPLLVAWAQFGAGRTDAALVTLRPVAEGQQGRGVYPLHAALIADLGDRPGEAARLYQMAQAEYDRLNLRLGQLLASWYARHGAAEEARAVLRRTVGTNGDLALAHTALEAAVQDRAVRSATDGIAEAYLAMAATLRQQNATDIAQVVLRLALDMRPDFTPARLLMADLQDATRPEAALATLAPVPASDPLAAVVGLRRAALLAATDRSDEAAALLDRLAQDHPDRPEPLVQLGDMQRRKSRFAEAAATYTRALERVKEPGTTDWALYYERAIAFDRSGRWDRAEADFKRALELSPDQPYALNYLAYSWAEQGRNLDQARGMLERAAVLRPEDGSIIDSLGWVLYRQGDLPGAIGRLERAVELQPGDAAINGHLGDVYQAAGRTQEAAFQWRRALLLKPEPDEAARIEAKLQALPGATPPARSR